MIVGLVCSTNLDIYIEHRFDRSLESNSDEVKIDFVLFIVDSITYSISFAKKHSKG